MQLIPQNTPPYCELTYSITIATFWSRSGSPLPWVSFLWMSQYQESNWGISNNFCQMKVFYLIQQSGITRLLALPHSQKDHFKLRTLRQAQEGKLKILPQKVTKMIGQACSKREASTVFVRQCVFRLIIFNLQRHHIFGPDLINEII